jgi:hypothetical protein
MAAGPKASKRIRRTLIMQNELQSNQTTNANVRDDDSIDLSFTVSDEVLEASAGSGEWVAATNSRTYAGSVALCCAC